MLRFLGDLSKNETDELTNEAQKVVDFKLLHSSQQAAPQCHKILCIHSQCWLVLRLTRPKNDLRGVLMC